MEKKKENEVTREQRIYKENSILSQCEHITTHSYSCSISEDKANSEHDCPKAENEQRMRKMTSLNI